MAGALNAVRLAVILRGLDGLFLPEVPSAEVFALVRSASPEDAWARELLPAARVLSYTLDGDAGPCPSTETILCRSDAHRLLAESGVGALLLSASCSAGTYAWARRHGVELLMVPYQQQRRLEDKLAFDALLKAHRIPRPASCSMTLGVQRRLPLRGPLVVQVPASMGGEGTFFVEGHAGLPSLVASGAIPARTRVLLRERVDGLPHGITIFVTPERIALSAVRLQCYHPRDDGGARHAPFAGIQWVPTRALSSVLARRINDTFLKLGELLHRRRFFGFANVDFMVDARERVLVIECNPRMSAATPQLLMVPALLSGLEAGELLLRGYFEERVYGRSFLCSPLPDSDYHGATLDVVPLRGPSRVLCEHRSGLYRRSAEGLAYVEPDVRRCSGPDDFCLFSFACAGQTCHSDDTLATLLSSFPLYDDQGAMLPVAHRMLSTFRYTE